MVMNERIKQLAEQAGILKEQTVKAKIVKNEDGTWTSILEYPDLEKFAELIVRECADIATINSHQWHSAGRFVLTHFGLEE
jgi:hypothetical protein